MEQRNPWQWDTPHAEPETPAPAPEPQAEVETEDKPQDGDKTPDGDPVWNTFTMHSQIDGWASENGVTTPDDWAGMTLAVKREWLYLNVGP